MIQIVVLVVEAAMSGITKQLQEWEAGNEYKKMTRDCQKEDHKEEEEEEEEDTTQSRPQLTGNMGDNNTPSLTPLIGPQSLSFRMPMPLPGAVGIPLFEGANTTEFLDRFDDLCREYVVVEEDKLAKLPRYCLRNVGDAIKLLKE